MPDGQRSPPGVSLFDGAAGQNLGYCNLSAAGRDHINLSISLATGAAGHQYPPQTPQNPASAAPLVDQASRPPVQRLSFLARVSRRFRTSSRRRAHNDIQHERDNATPCLAPEHQPTPEPPPPSLVSDAVMLPDGSNITSFDSRSQLLLARLHVSSEEEVYARSLLSKGHGFPIYNPPPFGRPVRLGDLGILSQDGFELFGNLFDPNDQREFSIKRPPPPETTYQAGKLHEGQVITTGFEDAGRLSDVDMK
ncbi:hypothetical protein BKA70DRAFT_295282 [Coprinopsis sp. MPI-PUGE-AT-0042]|nr:hypothetical protein BKA70DRAFT_295282 [Coprinopsis sp. MPI-PUGE-AT-0042]